MSDIYKAPESNVDHDDEQTVMLRRLYKEQSYIAAFLGAVFGLIPGLLLTMFLVSESGTFVTMLVLLTPGIAAGIGVKFCSRAFEARVRLPAAIFTVIVMLLFFYLFIPYPRMIFMAFLDGLIVLAMSRRVLSYEQEKVLYAHRIGKIKL